MNTSYGAIGAELKAKGCEKPGIRDVSEAVIAIRRSKLPDPRESWGIVAVFSKIPGLRERITFNCKKHFPEIPGYKFTDTDFKVPAGWLIEQCGFKGRDSETRGCTGNRRWFW